MLLLGGAGFIFMSVGLLDERMEMSMTLRSALASGILVIA